MFAMLSARFLAASTVALISMTYQPVSPPKPKAETWKTTPISYAAPIYSNDGCSARICIKTKGDQCRYSYNTTTQRYVQRCWGALHCIAYRTEQRYCGGQRSITSGIDDRAKDSLE